MGFHYGMFKQMFCLPSPPFSLTLLSVLHLPPYNFLFIHVSCVLLSFPSSSHGLSYSSMKNVRSGWISKYESIRYLSS